MESILNWEYISLIPPLLTLLLVLLTRKVGISLGVGILTSAFVIAGADIMETLRMIWNSFAIIFVDGGAINTWNAFILIFLSLLGIMTAFINMSGGARAFTALGADEGEIPEGCQHGDCTARHHRLHR